MNFNMMTFLLVVTVALCLVPLVGYPISALVRWRRERKTRAILAEQASKFLQRDRAALGALYDNVVAPAVEKQRAAEDRAQAHKDALMSQVGAWEPMGPAYPGCFGADLGVPSGDRTVAYYSGPMDSEKFWTLEECDGACSVTIPISDHADRADAKKQAAWDESGGLLGTTNARLIGAAVLDGRVRCDGCRRAVLACECPPGAA